MLQTFSCSTQLSMNFIMFINVKMPTFVGILTFISIIKTSSENLRARNVSSFYHFSFYDQLKLEKSCSVGLSIDFLYYLRARSNMVSLL